MPKNKSAPLRKDFTYCKWVTKGSVTGPKTLSDLDDILCQILSNIVQYCPILQCMFFINVLFPFYTGKYFLKVHILIYYFICLKLDT